MLALAERMHAVALTRGPPPRRRASSPAAANTTSFKTAPVESHVASTLDQGRPVFRGR